MRNPFELGAEARKTGLRVKANPYRQGSIEWTRWRNGYESATAEGRKGDATVHSDTTQGNAAIVQRSAGAVV